MDEIEDDYDGSSIMVPGLNAKGKREFPDFHFYNNFHDVLDNSVFEK